MLLIDGYNLLHVTGLVGRRGGLQGSREALLKFLASLGVAQEKGGCTIVFDAAGAPPGLPRRTTHEGIVVEYAQGYPDADTLLEELIEANHAPRTMTVISSDHRVQRAARRRRSRTVDSDVWFADAVRRRAAKRFTPQTAKPVGPLSPMEVEYWLSKFAAAEAPEEKPQRPLERPIENPFPEGYAEDMTEGD